MSNNLLSKERGEVSELFGPWRHEFTVREERDPDRLDTWIEATRQIEARMRVELNETANANYIAGKEQGEKQMAEARLKEAGWWALQRVEYGSEKATKHIAELERDLAALGEGK